MAEGVILVSFLTFMLDSSLNAPFADRKFRPKEFVKTSGYPEDSDDEHSTVGKMPPSDSEDE